MNRVYKCLISCISFIALLFMQTHIANAADADVTASAKPLKSCKFEDIPPINFGEISSLSEGSSYAYVSLTLKCSNGVMYKINSDGGLHNENDSSPYSPRRLSNGSNTLEYLLHHNKGFGNNKIWKPWYINNRLLPHEYIEFFQGRGLTVTHEVRAEISFESMKVLKEGFGTNFSDTVNVAFELF